jgi:hypothetical protein
MDPQQPFDLSEDFEVSIGRYEALTTHEKERFERACHWFQHAQDVWHISKSTALIAFVISVEALSPELKTLPRCDCCKQVTGITQAFRQRLTKLAPGVPINPEFYSTCSALAHGGKLLPSELRGWSLAYPGGDDDLLRALARTVRVALYNWLILAV